jgi:hypothetical protein
MPPAGKPAGRFSLKITLESSPEMNHCNILICQGVTQIAQGILGKALNFLRKLFHDFSITINWVYEL